ncbi:MAG TPA: DUF4339 domain-containing protein [Verrucomicrobiae bacterium]|nr:DUF4339 domain-containing protein [Verrucomicrobiae bacterium]
MDVTYQVVGADGQVYGPVSLADLQGWVRDGRVDATTRVSRSDLLTWGPAGELAELGLGAKQTVPPRPSPVQVVLEGASSKAGSADFSGDPAIRNAASWFYWIAGLSVVNSIMAYTGSGFGFIFGLGITQAVDGAVSESGNSAKAVALVVNLLLCALFVMFGKFGVRGKSWAFLVGMALYALDGALYLLFQAWLPVAFHAYAFYHIFKGWQQLRAVRS